MNDQIRLTDRDQLIRNRARSRDDALFLHEAAASQLQERLKEVNRTFTSVAIVTGQPAFWSRQFPDALLVEDSDTLALGGENHDLVIHAMALHWADDPVGQIVQCRRALRPDGLFLAVAFGGQTLAELRQSLAEAESELRGGLSPRIAPMGEIRDLGALLQRAGLAQPVADRDVLTASYADIYGLMRETRHMGEGNALASRDRSPVSGNLFDRAGDLYRRNHPAPDAPGRITATFELIYLSGWAPHESQQKPMRPGSATARLADALGSAPPDFRDDSRGSDD